MEFFYSHPYLIGLISCAIGAMFMPIVIQIARKKHFVVRPNKRMCHVGEVPNIGGIDICCSFLFTYLIFEFTQIQEYQFLLFGVFIIVMVGFVDDVLVLSPLAKLFGEILAGLALVCFADIRITSMQGIFGIETLSTTASYLISVFILLAITNAINLIDGVDGLASGLGMMYCLFFALYFITIDMLSWAILGICMIGSLAVFFCYNVFGRTQRKIFMGDSGSLLLGYLLSAFVFKLCEANAYHMLPDSQYMAANPVVCICVLTVPVWDTIRVSVTRIIQHRSPFSPDTNHIHHWLLRLGLNHVQTTCVILGFSALCIGLGMIGRNWNMWVLLATDAAFYALFIYAIHLCHRFRTRRSELPTQL